LIQIKATFVRRRFVACVAIAIFSLILLRPVTAAPISDGVVFYPGASLRFDHLNSDNGLSQNAILALLQDRQGYIWVATQDGLNRYDGYSFTHFRNIPSDPDSISYNSLSALYEATDGYLWVGTLGGGLNRYDPKTGKFAHYLPAPANPGSLGNPIITTIFPGGVDKLWVGTLGGLDLLDTATGRFTHFHNNGSNMSTLSSNAISVIAKAADGKLWIGTGAYGTSGEGLNLFDPATGKSEHIPPNVFA